jgi:hypothetical protein
VGTPILSEKSVVWALELAEIPSNATPIKLDVCRRRTERLRLVGRHKLVREAEWSFSRIELMEFGGMQFGFERHNQTQVSG